jgi:hypothetical protein
LGQFLPNADHAHVKCLFVLEKKKKKRSTKIGGEKIKKKLKIGRENKNWPTLTRFRYSTKRSVEPKHPSFFVL